MTNLKETYAYEELSRHGSKELKNKVTELLDLYYKNPQNPEFNFRIVEKDEDRKEEGFTRAILTYEPKGKESSQLEMLIDFSLDSELYGWALANTTFKVITLFSHQQKSFLNDATVERLEVTKGYDESDRLVVTKKGTMFTGTKRVQTVEISENEF